MTTYSGTCGELFASLGGLDGTWWADSGDASIAGWFGLVWFGLVWFGLVWFGLVWFGLELVVLLLEPRIGGGLRMVFHVSS